MRVSCVGQRLQPLQAADDAANPAAGRPVDDRPALARDRVAHREHVLLREVHVQIAVGVRRIRDVPVANARVERAGVVERLVRLRDLRQALEALPVPGPGDVGRQPQPRVLVRDDRLAGLAERLVRAGLLGVPVRIEERVNRTAAGQAGDRLHQRVGRRRRIRHRRAGRRRRRFARRRWLLRGFSRRTDRRSIAGCRRLRTPLAPVPRPGVEPARPERFRRRRRPPPSIFVDACDRPDYADPFRIRLRLVIHQEMVERTVKKVLVGARAEPVQGNRARRTRSPPPTRLPARGS